MRQAVSEARTGAACRALRRVPLLLALLVFSLAVAALAAGPNERGAVGRVKSGTGFFVSGDGFLVTSAHVVAGCQNISVWAPNGTERPSHVIAFDRRRDVALLWADGMRATHSAIVTPMPPQPGAEVFTLGYGVIATKPLMSVVVEGALIGDSMAQPGNRIVVIRAKLHSGNSGGAVLARDSSLIGMVVGRDDEHPEFGVAIPKEDIEALLSGYGIRLPRRDPAPNPRDFLGAISVLIQCSPSSRSTPRPRTGLAEEHVVDTVVK